MSYLRSAPSNLLNAKFCKKAKMPKLGTKNALLGYFWQEMPYLGIFGLEFWKAIVIFEISTLKFVKYESLTHIVNFGIGSAFSKGPGSAFSEGPGPGPDPLYKVCLPVIT